MKATETQVGGSHYKNLRIQPVELTYELGETSGFQNVAKYLTRNKGSNVEDWEKAIHFIKLEEEMVGRFVAARGLRSSHSNDPNWRGKAAARISSFAGQFPAPVDGCVYSTLRLLAMGEYQEAAKCVQDYLEELKRRGWPSQHFDGVKVDLRVPVCGPASYK